MLVDLKAVLESYAQRVMFTSKKSGSAGNSSAFAAAANDDDEILNHIATSLLLTGTRAALFAFYDMVSSFAIIRHHPHHPHIIMPTPALSSRCSLVPARSLCLSLSPLGLALCCSRTCALGLPASEALAHSLLQALRVASVGVGADDAMGWGQVTALVPEATLVRTEGSSWSAWFGVNDAGQKLLELDNVSNADLR
eukprot:1946465-Rhodomonas_salina.1